MRYWIILIFLIGFLKEGIAQDKYWVIFSDKGDVNSVCPEDLFSPKALQRRDRLQIPLDSCDFPLYALYLDSLKLLNINVISQSRWLNAVSVRLSRHQVEELAKLAFVKRVVPVALAIESRLERVGNSQRSANYQTQLSMIGLDALHASGFTGEGVTIAVLDNGFLAVDTLSAFSHVFERGGGVGMKDFVEWDEDVMGPCRGSCKHGTGVLSLLAARVSGELIGAAPDADFLLARTENDTAELHQEEDAWLAAAEWADSMGADVIVSSLNYRNFDVGQGNYSSSDFDGNTALITIAADIAASKGISVVVSAGNGGTRGIDAPADGDGVIAVGSVDDMREHSSFSGIGPSADGRIKPDLVAMGEQTLQLTTKGEVKASNGTSNSCPLIGGLVACLLEGSKGITPQMSIYNALIQSADHFAIPNNDVGYGIPNGIEAFRLLTGTALLPFPMLPEDEVHLHSSLESGEIHVALLNERSAYTLNVSLTDMLGRRIFTQEAFLPTGFHRLTFSPSVNPGIYTLQVFEVGGLRLASRKILIR